MSAGGRLGYNGSVEVYLVTFGAFVVAVLGMGIGVLVRGKALKGSCGGVDPTTGRSLGDCLCERLKKPICESRKSELQAAGTRVTS
jgi:hypothetical protein